MFSLWLTLRLRNVGSPPVQLPREAVVCGGMRGRPFSATLFIFLIFVEGNKSWGEDVRPRTGQEGWQKALAEGQQMKEAGHRFPTSSCTSLTPCLNLPQAPPSSAAPLDGEHRGESPLLSLVSFPSSAICLDAAGCAGANSCIHKKPLQDMWTHSHQEQDFPSYQCPKVPLDTGSR